MKKIEKKIFDNFVKFKNEKTFFTLINKIFQKEIGFILLTLTVAHPKKKLVQRIYSSNNKIYPIGGTKKIPNNYLYEVIFKKQKSFIANNIRQIKKYHFDHQIIYNLGAESMLNQVVIFDNKTIGTINFLNKSNHFNTNHLKITNLISKFIAPIYLNHQIKMKN